MGPGPGCSRCSRAPPIKGTCSPSADAPLVHLYDPTANFPSYNSTQVSWVFRSGDPLGDRSVLSRIRGPGRGAPATAHCGEHQDTARPQAPTSGLSVLGDSARRLRCGRASLGASFSGGACRAYARIDGAVTAAAPPLSCSGVKLVAATAGARVERGFLQIKYLNSGDPRRRAVKLTSGDPRAGACCRTPLHCDTTGSQPQFRDSEGLPWAAVLGDIAHITLTCECAPTVLRSQPRGPSAYTASPTPSATALAVASSITCRAPWLR